MKKYLLIVFAISVFTITFNGCETLVENRITIRNQAEEQITLVIQGKTYKVAASTELVLNDFNRGTFPYTTLFVVPLNATSYSTEGDTEGTLTLIGGTQYLLIYTSELEGGAYKLTALLSSSDSDDRIDPFEQ